MTNSLRRTDQLASLTLEELEGAAKLMCIKTSCVALHYAPKGPWKLIHPKTSLQNLRICFGLPIGFEPNFEVIDKDIEEKLDLDRFHELTPTSEIAYLL